MCVPSDLLTGPGATIATSPLGIAGLAKSKKFRQAAFRNLTNPQSLIPTSPLGLNQGNPFESIFRLLSLFGGGEDGF